jgi:hypothetical protein
MLCFADEVRGTYKWQPLSKADFVRCDTGVGGSSSLLYVHAGLPFLYLCHENMNVYKIISVTAVSAKLPMKTHYILRYKLIILQIFVTCTLKTGLQYYRECTFHRWLHDVTKKHCYVETDLFRNKFFIAVKKMHFNKSWEGYTIAAVCCKCAVMLWEDARECCKRLQECC